MSIKITVDLEQHESVMKAIQQWIKILQSDYYLNNPDQITIEDVKQGVLEPKVLKHTRLWHQVTAIIPKSSSDLVFILKLIEWDMETEASDIAFAMSTFLKQVDYSRLPDRNWHILGLDVIYAVASAYPYWAYCLGRGINANWPKASHELLLPVITVFIKTEKWTDDTLGIFVYCDVDDIRMALSELDLKYFLNSPSKLKLFKKIIVRKHKTGLSADQIERYFETAQTSYTVKDIQDVLKQVHIKKIKQVQTQTKGYVVEKTSSLEAIIVKYMLMLPQETEVTLKVEHPENELGKTISKSKVQCHDGEINLVNWRPHCSGTYVVTLLIKGKPVIKERFLIEDKMPTKIRDIEVCNFKGATWQPFESMEEPFGIKFTIESGKAKGLIYHPRFIKELPSSIIETDVTESRYLNEGQYDMVFDPRGVLNFEKGFFEFLLWDEQETELLYRHVFYEERDLSQLTSQREELEFIESLALETFHREDPKRFNRNVLRQTIGEFDTLFERPFFIFYTKEEVIETVVALADDHFNTLNGDLPSHVDPTWQKAIQSKQKSAWTDVLNYGVYEMADNFAEGVNISLKPQKKYLKAKLGSYFGLSYKLNPSWFKQDITISCNVSLVKAGEKIIDETWNDIAYHDKMNQFVYKIETQEEVQDGWWRFELYHQNECILNQTIAIDI